MFNTSSDDHDWYTKFYNKYSAISSILNQDNDVFDYKKISKIYNNNNDGYLQEINRLILQINAVSETLLDHSTLFKIGHMDSDTSLQVHGTLKNVLNALVDVDRALGN